MLLSVALALALPALCHAPGQTQAAPEQRVDVEAALRERGFDVEFTGNQVFTRRELLDILSCDKRATTYLVEGSAAEKFSEDDKDFQKLHASVSLLTHHLRSRGYLKAVARVPRVETTAGRKLVMTVNEGALYRVGKVEFRGSKLIVPERLAEMFPLKAGDVADGEAIYDFLFEKVKKLYDDQGHIQYEADSEPTFTAEPDARAGVVDFLITVNEGRRFVLRSVVFEGNAKTPDEQLRPLLLMREGGTYSQALAEESLKKLEATALFERIDPAKDVDYRLDEEGAGVRVKIRLKEKSTP